MLVAMHASLAAAQARVPTTTTLTPPEDRIVAGQSVTLTAKVEAIGSASASPSGSVVFVDGPRQIGTATLSAKGQGSASASLSVTLAAGPHVIVVRYPGDAGFAPSMSFPPLTEEVR